MNRPSTVRTALGALPGAILVAILIAPLPAAAQKVWRCGPEGRTFSDRPCKGGDEVVLDTRVPAAAAAEARAVSVRERQALQTLSAERKERHADAAGQGAAGIQPGATPETRSKPAPRKPPRKVGAD